MAFDIANNSTLTTDFNVSPYYDDYDDIKGYYRNLFKPGYAVQARELTQSQTMLQKQIDRFAKHVFLEGSIVLPGQYKIENDVDYVKIKDLDNVNTAVDVSEYLNTTLRGGTNDISAYVIEVATGTETDANTKTLFVRYVSGSSSNTQIKTFVENETLIANGSSSLTTISANSTGKGSRFIISSGIFFAKEHFIKFDTQSVLLSRYTTTPSCKVGFNIYEEIVTSEDDINLLDPALEASNYAAPGADRLKLTPTLQVLDYDDDAGAPDFVELFKIKDGIVTELFNRPQYNIIQDEIAKRTFDESGDYYVNGFGVRVRENLDIASNGGLSNTGNSQLLSVGVEPGVAYPKGYEINKLVTEYINIPKSTTYTNVNAQIATAGMGSYLRCKEFTGSVTADQYNLITLYDTANRRLTNKIWGSGAAVGNSIGTARVQSIEWDSNSLGTPSGNVLIYLTDIKMNGTNTFANVKSLAASGFGADPILNIDNNNTLLESVGVTLLYKTGSTGVRTIRDSSGNPDMTFNFKRSTDVSIVTGGTFTLPLAISGESFPYGTTTLSSSDKRDIILNLKADVNVSCNGTVSGTVGTSTITGSSTQFTRLNVGDKIEIAGKSNTFFIYSITSDTSLTITENLPAGISGNVFFKAYKSGDIIDLTTTGITRGSARSVSATPTQLSFDLQETLLSSVAGTVTYQVTESSAKEITKNLRDNRYVIINCATAGIKGPYCLGFPDVYQVRAIILKNGSAPTSISDGTDVTSQFTIDNGQKDAFYDLATISPNNVNLTTTDYLLVQLDWFEPSYTVGRGYFSIDSYPIDDTVTSNTKIRTENIPIFVSPTTYYSYDLRNYIDFRPVRTKTATDSTTVGGATTNPATGSTFSYETNGLRFPVPSSQYTYDYSYYLNRIDLICVDKKGAISVVQGIPEATPRTPVAPENVMALASVYVPAYPSLAPNYAQMIKRTDLACSTKKKSNIRFTMQDIGVLKNRIENLEYYAGLSLLEKAAVDMQILDENGLNRFKNGIFVDTFSDHSLGATKDPNYRIVVDGNEKSLRPIYTMDSLGYDYLSGTNVVKTGDLITLPYTNVVMIDQPAVTSYRNVELTSYRFVGKLSLTPDTDIWTDTETLEDEGFSFGPTAENLPQPSVYWNAWQTKVVGYQAEDRSRPTNGNGEVYVGMGGWGGATGNLIDPGFYTADPNDPNNFGGMNWNNLRNQPTYWHNQRITQITETSRTGVQTNYSLSSETVKLGSKVVNVSLATYIRPQYITFNASGVKANTKLHTFFDDENMSQYVTPCTKSQYTSEILTGTLPNEGTDLVSDYTGNAYGILRLPAGTDKRFRVGTKEVIVTDSSTNSVDASTFATSYFVSQGLVQQKQNTILTTRKIISYQTSVAETGTRQEGESKYIQSCSAYSFLPKAPEGEDGVFLTKVQVWFQAVHPTLGVWFEIREMDSAGGITRTTVPLSDVWFEAADIPRSDDASLPLDVVFKSPIFLYNNVQYAFVIHTVGLNPDTYLWISRLGETDINTGKTVTSRPLTGTFYTTNNNMNWDMVPDVDLKIKFYRASFTTGVIGQAVLGNKPFEKLMLANVSSNFTQIGERIISNYRLTCTGNTGSILLGDYLIGANSGANSKILEVNGATYKVANTQYIDGETLKVYDANVASRGVNTTVQVISSGAGTLSKYINNSYGNYIELSASNGVFAINDVITGTQSGATANVTSIQNKRYSVADFEPAKLIFGKTDLSFLVQTTSNTSIQGTYENIIDNDNHYFDTEKAILSRTNEIASIASDRSNKIQANMSTTTEYLSPVIDLGRTHSVYVDNIINANTYCEEYSGVTLILSGNTASINIGDRLTSTAGANSFVIANTVNNYTVSVPSVTKFIANDRVSIYTANMVSKSITSNVTSVLYDYNIQTSGQLINKYISLPTTLAENQDAEDIQIVLTAYRPPTTDVKVYIRLCHAEDSTVFSVMPWIECSLVNSTIYTSLSNLNDFRDYTYRLPTGMMIGAGGSIQYTNPQGAVFSGYKYFAIKIGLSGTNSAVIPRVADLRVICLQM